jgi:hypothetical protein
MGQLAYLIDEKTVVQVEQPSNLPGARDDLGVARRAENPADTVGAIGQDPAKAECGGRDTPFCAPPVVRPPAASTFR